VLIAQVALCENYYLRETICYEVKHGGEVVLVLTVPDRERT